MTWDDIPRTRSFSLGDFHDFDRCPFLFFVSHHLEKKYELAEGSPAQAVGTLLDLAIKKLHQIKAYYQPVDYLQNLVKAVEVQLREDIVKRGKNSFYGSLLDFLTPEVLQKAKEVFKNYCQTINGKFKKQVVTQITQKIKPFWEHVIPADFTLKIWGGPDAIEMGSDGMPEIVDYKYFEDLQKGKSYLDMDLMPKIYTLVCAKDLQGAGYSKARFRVGLWQDPLNESLYEEFDLSLASNLEDFFKDKIERILRTKELSFCDKEYCKACKSPKRGEWIAELKVKGWIN